MTDHSESPVNILFIEKNIPEPNISYVCDEELLQWKRDYWKSRIAGIKKVIAPMVDQSELAFREFVTAHGGDLAFTPMIHAHLFATDATYRRTSLQTWAGERERGYVVQFCANDPVALLKACKLVEGFCSGVDVNLGCPQMIAKKGNYGAFLQDRPEVVFQMINQVYLHCKLPISAKIRILDTVPETIEYARMIEKAGASMITIHGRTRAMKGPATGLADWDHIRAVREALSIPVIANGNIQVPGDVDKCLEATKADAVMSAEGILFNPLLFEGSFRPCYDVALEYLSYAKKFGAGSSSVRAHIFRICHHLLIQSSDLRTKMSIISTMPDFEALVNELATLHPVTEEDLAQAQKTVANQALFPTLADFIQALPPWLAKPYIRPATLNAASTSEGGEPSAASEYRSKKREEVTRLAQSTGLSKRQIRRKERRRLDAIRVRDAKKTYPRCRRCQQPAGATCRNDSCRACCRLQCIIDYLSCHSHKFMAEKLKSKREAYLAENGGIAELRVSTTEADAGVVANGGGVMSESAD